MAKTAEDLDFDTLAKIAKAATDDVRADAIRRDVMLPVWRDGKVVYEGPSTGAIFVHDRDRRASSQPMPGSAADAGSLAEAQLQAQLQAKFQALRDLGIELPFDTSPKPLRPAAKPKRAAND